MNIYYVEGFMAQSHREWIESYQRYSLHKVSIFSLSGRHWKWRMQGGAISLAEKINREEVPDLFLVSAMIDLPLFKSLLHKRFQNIPMALYFHENQFAYPEGIRAKKNELHHYSFMNFKSALVSKKVFFNSNYNKESFFSGAASLLKMMPDLVEDAWLDEIKSKSQVLPLGIDRKVQIRNSPTELPLILWNHRWEHDKNPEEFFRLLFELKEEGVKFELAVLGESFKDSPPIFEKAKEILKSEIKHWGFQESSTYKEILLKATILPVTSYHEFFGVSVFEAVMSGAMPILPNRLAYPENFPSKYLYSNFDELKNKLRQAILEGGSIDNELRTNLKKFEWTNMAKKYDDEFLKV